MKLTDLIKALADEVDIMRPELDGILSSIEGLKSDNEEFLSQVDTYNDYVLRMGEAADMLGFAGLNALCSKVQENTLLLSIAEDDEREELVGFLKKWPVQISEYLNKIDNPDISKQLIELFKTAPAGLTEAEVEETQGQLDEIAQQANDGAVFKDPDNIRPTEATPEDVSLEMPDDLDNNLMDGFLQESPDMALSLVTWAQELANGADVDLEELKTAKRYIHTLKGTGATIGARGLASVGHHLEDIIEYLEANPSETTQPLANLILDACYCLEQMVAYIADTDDQPENAMIILQQLLDVANKIDDGEPLVAEDFKTNYRTTEKVDTNFAENKEIQSSKKPTKPKAPNAKKKATKNKDKGTSLRVPVSKIDELFRVSGEISIHSSAMEDRIKLLTEQTKQLLEQNLRVQKRLFELETLVDVRALSLMRGRTNSDEEDQKDFDPLEMDQYNELHSSAHALVEETADARVVANTLEEQIANLSSMQSRQQVLSRDLQHLVIGTRMSEVGEIESRLQRNVRTTSQMTGKMANLIMTGQDTLIDSDLIGKLADPLLHIIRNAVDHGLETPEEREAKGKDLAGNIYLSFFRQGQQVVMRCEDDGRGLNIEKIRQRGIEHGLITEQQDLSDHEIAQLIFRSGFSSRDTVSEVSGRGVGLDVVRDWANQMNGSIHIETGEYGGCLFELRFAASLSTVQSLVVSVDDAYFALPAIQIEQAISNKDVGIFDYVNENFVFFYDNEYITAHLLSDLIGLPTSQDKEFSEYFAVIITVDNKRYALAVDDLIDSRELLVKPAGRFARHLTGVSGLSILGNGSVAVNLDLAQLVNNSSQQIVRSSNVKQLAPKVDVPKILIVDDALTVRNSLQQFIQDLGFEAHTARDGLDAVNKLNEIKPTVVLTDMEMPNMNGIELTQHIRHRNDMVDLPIIMITSRSQDKHRELANNAGVSDYITKPYSDINLLESIKKFL